MVKRTGEEPEKVPDEEPEEHEDQQAEPEEVVSGAQSGEGYGCICGFKTADLKSLRRHFITEPRKDPPGTHKSLGRINLATGEKTMGTWVERSPSEKKSTIYSVKRQLQNEPIKLTDNLAGAQLIKWVPRVFQTDYSPIMRAARAASSRLWGWPIDEDLTVWNDRIILAFFGDRGIHLASFTVDEEVYKKQMAEKAAIGR